jgi:hypothetical protein
MSLTHSELTTRMQTEFATAWVEVKRTPAPPPSPDMHVLFAAVARAVLGYLKDHEGDLITSLDVAETGVERSFTSVDATLGIEAR